MAPSDRTSGANSAPAASPLLVETEETPQNFFSKHPDSRKNFEVRSRPSSLSVERWTLNVERFYSFFLASRVQQLHKDRHLRLWSPHVRPGERSMTARAAFGRRVIGSIKRSRSRRQKHRLFCNVIKASSACTKRARRPSAASTVMLAIPHRPNEEQAHILPHNKEFWKTSANPPTRPHGSIMSRPSSFVS